MPTYMMKPLGNGFILCGVVVAVPFFSWLCSVLQVRDNIYNIVKEFMSNEVNTDYTIY